MEDPDDAIGEDGENGKDGAAPTWGDLFARAAPHGVEESAVREALARRREGG